MEIRIGKTARSCFGCGRAFVHDEELTSLVRIQDQALVREDYCPACWNPQRGQGAFSVWSLRFYDPKVAEQDPPEVFSPLRQIFYEAVEADDRAELAKAYLAAQLLRRQKAFRWIKESEAAEGGPRVVLFADRIGGRLIEVRDPNLTFAEMEQGRAALMARLNELENPQSAEQSHDDAEPEEN